MLLKSRVPIVELIHAVAEDESFSHRQVGEVGHVMTLGETCLVKGLSNDKVFHLLVVEEVLHLERRGFEFLRTQR